MKASDNCRPDADSDFRNANRPALRRLGKHHLALRQIIRMNEREQWRMHIFRRPAQRDSPRWVTGFNHALRIDDRKQVRTEHPGTAALGGTLIDLALKFAVEGA